MKIVSGNSNLSLAKKISEHLKVPLLDATIKKFPDKEIFVEIKENVRGEDVFVIQSTSFPANDHVMELLITIDALKRVQRKELRQLSLIMDMLDKIENQVQEHQFQQS